MTSSLKIQLAVSSADTIRNEEMTKETKWKASNKLAEDSDVQIVSCPFIIDILYECMMNASLVQLKTTDLRRMLSDMLLLRQLRETIIIISRFLE